MFTVNLSRLWAVFGRFLLYLYLKCVITAHKRLYHMVLAFAAGLDGDVPTNQPFGEPLAQNHGIFSFFMPLQRG